ncbi:phospholipase D-like domain-containing protein [Chitinophaga sp. LS1]|uniref:phospholipase D-like domain-containing protein n=1 Tax=Chitinophaga sp. LS1 TaxID=3051176 RepID=UPI002AABE725|nr:phospholipase D-like domain-containing protein [Chitinophaga sp. LS1]WPV68152.1 phospholipase D-like domain-containing protein [Chitinophaga sp. LS1]
MSIFNPKAGLNIDKHFDTYLKKPSGPYSNIMHDKFCIIDLKVVIHGSYNWTKKSQYNKETFVIEKGRENAENFSTEFI